MTLFSFPLMALSNILDWNWEIHLLGASRSMNSTLSSTQNSLVNKATLSERSNIKSSFHIKHHKYFLFTNLPPTETQQRVKVSIHVEHRDLWEAFIHHQSLWSSEYRETTSHQCVHSQLAWWNEKWWFWKRGKKSPCWGSSFQQQVRRTTCLWGTEGYGSPHLTGLDSEDGHTHTHTHTHRNTVKHLNLTKQFCDGERMKRQCYSQSGLLGSSLLNDWSEFSESSSSLLSSSLLLPRSSATWGRISRNFTDDPFRVKSTNHWDTTGCCCSCVVQNVSVVQVEIRYLFICGRVDPVLVLWVIVVLQFFYERVGVNIIIVVIVVVICVWGIIIIILVFIILKRKQLLSSFIIISNIRPEFKERSRNKAGSS